MAGYEQRDGSGPTRPRASFSPRTARPWSMTCRAFAVVNGSGANANCPAQPELLQAMGVTTSAIVNRTAFQ